MKVASSLRLTVLDLLELRDQEDPSGENATPIAKPGLDTMEMRPILSRES
jgi:hypothetical protein